jgi:hypothetical protein
MLDSRVVRAYGQNRGVADGGKWQMKDANPGAVEAVCGRLYLLQAIVVLYLVIIIRA